jgi:hypothetical protein
MSLVWGKRPHGIHRCWILVTVPIDVTNFDDGHWRRDVLGFYVDIFQLTTWFSTMVIGNFVTQGVFCYFWIDSWNLSYLMPIASIHVIGCKKKAPWTPLSLDVGHGANRCDAFWWRLLVLMDFDGRRTCTIFLHGHIFVGHLRLMSRYKVYALHTRLVRQGPCTYPQHWVPFFRAKKIVVANNKQQTFTICPKHLSKSTDF